MTDPIAYDSSDPLWIGSDRLTDLPTFERVIDEVALYASALSQKRIEAHHAAGTTP